MTDAHGYLSYEEYTIVRATSHKNAICHFSEADERETQRRDYGGAYAPYIGHEVVGEHDGYATKDEAITALEQLKKARLRISQDEVDHEPKV